MQRRSCTSKNEHLNFKQHGNFKVNVIFLLRIVVGIPLCLTKRFSAFWAARDEGFCDYYSIHPIVMSVSKQFLSISVCWSYEAPALPNCLKRLQITVSDTIYFTGWRYFKLFQHQLDYLCWHERNIPYLVQQHSKSDRNDWPDQKSCSHQPF